MKLVCDSCGTKYSIGDDRVAGKVFKIRCKKCANVMVVRGVAAEPVVAEPVVTDSSDWHVVVEGQQAGPFSRVELLRKRASGELDHDTFVWREGLADWVALGTLEELHAELAPAEPTASTPAAETPAAARLLNERNESSVLFTLGNLAKLATPPAKATATATASTGTEGSGLIDIRALASTFAPAKASKAMAGAVGSSDDLPMYAPTTFAEPIVLVPNARAKRPDRRIVVALFATLAMLAVLAVVLVLVLLRKPDTAEAAGTRVANAEPRASGDTSDVANAASNGASSNSASNGASSNGAANGTGNGASAGASNGASDGASSNGASSGTNGVANGNGASSNGTASNGTASSGTSTGSSTGSSTGTTSGASSNGTASRGTSSTGTRGTSGATSNGAPTRGTSTGTSSNGTSTRTGTSSTGTSSTGTSTRTGTSRTPTLTPDKEPNSCTDVACAFNNYKDDCCKVFRPGNRTTTTTTTTQPTGQLNDNLDRGQLAAGIATIRAQACGGRSSSRGDVTVSVKVSAEGQVIGVTIKSSPDPALSACVSAAAQKGAFAKTKRGGTFSYFWRF